MIFKKLFWLILLCICFQGPLKLHAQAIDTQEDIYKVGVLYPNEPSLVKYAASWSDGARRVNQLASPQIELVEQPMMDGPAQAQQTFEALAAKDVIAIIAPLFQVQLWISPGLDKPIQRIPLVEMPTTKSDLEQLPDDLSAHLMEEPILQELFQKLKFQGDLQDTLLLPVVDDPFGTTGTAAFTHFLEQENISFVERELAANVEKCSLQLRQAKFNTPNMTLMISASSAKGEGIIHQAREVIGVAGLIVMLVGDYQPVIFDLAEENSDTQATWPIQMESAHVAKLSSDLQLAPSTVPFLGALWATMAGLESSDTQSRSEFQAALAASQLEENDFFVSTFGPSLLFNLYVVPMLMESWLTVDWNALLFQWMTEWRVDSGQWIVDSGQ